MKRLMNGKNIYEKFAYICKLPSHICEFWCRKEGDHEFMNIVSSEIADEVVKRFLLLNLFLRIMLNFLFAILMLETVGFIKTCFLNHVMEARIRIGWNNFRQLVPLLTVKDLSL